MYVQGVENVYDTDYNGQGLTYGDVFRQAEREFSTYNFEKADTDLLFRHFADAEKECGALIAARLPLPAYDQCIQASHTFNLLDARGVISVTERAAYIGRSEEHTSELQSLMRISYAVFCLKKKTNTKNITKHNTHTQHIECN